MLPITIDIALDAAKRYSIQIQIMCFKYEWQFEGVN